MPDPDSVAWDWWDHGVWKLVAFPNWKQITLCLRGRGKTRQGRRCSMEQKAKLARKPLQTSAFISLAFENILFPASLELEVIMWHHGYHRCCQLLVHCPFLTSFLLIILGLLLSLVLWVFFFSDGLLGHLGKAHVLPYFKPPRLEHADCSQFLEFGCLPVKNLVKHKYYFFNTYHMPSIFPNALHILTHFIPQLPCEIDTIMIPT